MLIAYLIVMLVLAVGFVVFGYISIIKDLPAEHFLLKITVICIIAFTVLLSGVLGYGLYRLVRFLFVEVF